MSEPKILVCQVSDKSVKCTDGKVVVVVKPHPITGKVQPKDTQDLFVSQVQELSRRTVEGDKGIPVVEKFKKKGVKEPIKTLTAQEIIDMV